MKPSRFSVRQTSCAVAEFYEPETDNLLRVESTGDGGVLICAAKDCFAPIQRQAFVRYLKTVGFIPEDVRLTVQAAGPLSVPRRHEAVWTFDPSWPYAEHRFNRYSRKLGWRLLLGLTIGWMLLIWLACFR